MKRPKPGPIPGDVAKWIRRFNVRESWPWGEPPEDREEPYGTIVVPRIPNLLRALAGKGAAKPKSKGPSRKPARKDKTSRKKRPPVKSNLVWKILATMDQDDEKLASGLQPAEIERKVLPRYRELKHGGSVSRTEIARTYRRYIKARSQQTNLGKLAK
jgi:hypothetical protein